MAGKKEESPPVYYTTLEASKIMKIQPTTLRELCRGGRISHYKIGNAYRFTYQNLKAYIIKREAIK